MTAVTIAVIGLVAVILAVQLKTVKAEYGVYLVLGAGLVIFFYGLSKLETVLETLKQIQSYIQIDTMYLGTMMKMESVKMQDIAL